MPSEEIKLKPCPFCGGESKIGEGYSDRIYGVVWVVAVWCTSCNALLERMESANALARSQSPDMLKKVLREKTIKDWNNWKEDGDNGK